MKLLNLLMLVLVSLSINAQKSIESPVDWTFEVTSQNNGQYLFTATAKIDKPWCVYSSTIGEDGPIPTSIDYKTKLISKKGIEEPSTKIEVYDNLFEMNLIKFKGEAIFTQVIKPDSDQKELTGVLTFMTCDENRCLPPAFIEFSLPLKP